MKHHRLTVLHIADLDFKRVGGPYRSILELARAQSRIGIKIGLLVRSRGGLSDSFSEFPIYCTSDDGNSYKISKLPKPFNLPSIINFHGCYLWRHAVMAQIARMRRIPYIITPRGSMTRGAQAQKRLKKVFGNLIFLDAMVGKAAAIHCLTEAEARDASRWSRPVFVVPNGTDLKVAPVVLSSGLVSTGAALHILFLGRFDINHKGLDILLQGLAIFFKCQPCANLHLSLIGPDQNGSRRKLETLIQKLELVDRVQILGPLVGREKEQTFHNAHVFVHTSRFEGQPLAVLEALARGLPCLLTPGTNLADQVVSAGAGWRCNPTSEGIASGLMEVVSSCANLPQMGQAARTLAERQFNWQGIAEQMIEQYETIFQIYHC